MINYDKLPPEWEEAIAHNATLIKQDIDRRILWDILHNDDMVRELTEEEIVKRVRRVGGGAICDFCGESYEDHPNETRLLSFDGYPYLKRLCDGTLGKT